PAHDPEGEPATRHLAQDARRVPPAGALELEGGERATRVAADQRGHRERRMPRRVFRGDRDGGSRLATAAALEDAVLLAAHLVPAMADEEGGLVGALRGERGRDGEGEAQA